jgi:hypothetical protein
MMLDVPHEAITASNVVFELPGNGSMDEVILVGTHYDARMFTGAVDNNGSVALMMAWAKYFASKPKKSRNRDMIFAWNDSYFYSDDKTAYHYPGVPHWAGTTWDWGDGTPPTAGGPMVNHVYNNPGAYTATMKFTDTENAVGTATVIIKVLAMP